MLYKRTFSAATALPVWEKTKPPAQSALHAGNYMFRWLRSLLKFDFCNVSHWFELYKLYLALSSKCCFKKSVKNTFIMQLSSYKAQMFSDHFPFCKLALLYNYLGTLLTYTRQFWHLQGTLQFGFGRILLSSFAKLLVTEHTGLIRSFSVAWQTHINWTYDNVICINRNKKNVPENNDSNFIHWQRRISLLPYSHQFS